MSSLMYEVFVLLSEAEQQRPPINSLPMHIRGRYPSKISSFKMILTSSESYNALEGRVDKIRALGEEYLEAFLFFALWLETVGGGTYQEASLWYELSAGKSVHVLYGLSKINAMLPEVVGRPPVQWQAFPLRHSLIPAYVQFDIGMVASHILNLPHKQIRLEYKNPDFWKQHFDFNRRPLRNGPGGREFDGTFWTDGYGVNILMRTPGGPKGAGQKRKRGQNRKFRDAELFPYFHMINRQDYNNTTTSYSLTPIFGIHCTSCISIVHETTRRFCVTRACLVVGIWGQTLRVIERRDLSNIRIMSTKSEQRNND